MYDANSTHIFGLSGSKTKWTIRCHERPREGVCVGGGVWLYEVLKEYLLLIRERH